MTTGFNQLRAFNKGMFPFEDHGLDVLSSATDIMRGTPWS